MAELLLFAASRNMSQLSTFQLVSQILTMNLLILLFTTNVDTISSICHPQLAALNKVTISSFYLLNKNESNQFLRSRGLSRVNLRTSSPNDRIISLVTYISKDIEKYRNEQLFSFLNNNHFIHDHQYHQIFCTVEY